MGRLKIWLVAALASASLSAPAVAETAAMATLPQGSLFHTMGSVIAKVARDNSDLNLVVQPFGGTKAALAAVDTGQAAFTILDVNEAIIALRGGEGYENDAKSNQQVVLIMRQVPVGIFVREDSDMQEVSDIKGKKYPSGWQAFPNGLTLSKGTFAAAGMTFDDVDGVPAADLITAANDFAAGKVDATIFAVGAPKVAEIDASVGGIRFLSIPNTPEALERMREHGPAYFIMEVPPLEHFVGIEKPTPLLAWDQVIVAGKHVSNETVRKLMTAMAENKPALAKAFPPFAAFNPDNMNKPFPDITYHPGAIEYYEENGAWPPER